LRAIGSDSADWAVTVAIYIDPPAETEAHWDVWAGGFELPYSHLKNAFEVDGISAVLAENSTWRLLQLQVVGRRKAAAPRNIR